MKQNKLANLFKQAYVVAENSHDSETQVGALLVHSLTGAVLSSGYNGFIRGADDANLPTTRPDKYPYMIHAEQNLLLNACRHGISTQDCIMVVTLSPCSQCMRMAYQAGIKTIYFCETYRDFNKQCEMKDLDISINGAYVFWVIELGVK